MPSAGPPINWKVKSTRFIPPHLFINLNRAAPRGDNVITSGLRYISIITRKDAALERRETTCTLIRATLAMQFAASALRHPFLSHSIDIERVVNAGRPWLLDRSAQFFYILPYRCTGTLTCSRRVSPLGRRPMPYHHGSLVFLGRRRKAAA
jgi:hypothetical protein